jgi:hypothetical protein
MQSWIVSLELQGTTGTSTFKEKRAYLGLWMAIGTVEAQGRGMLHLHMVLWLKDSVMSTRMKELLSSEQFQDKVKMFIWANIRAHIPGFVGTDVLTIPKQNAVGVFLPSGSTETTLPGIVSQSRK